MRTIVIIGGGFCGTVLATRLLREPPVEPTRVVLIERAAEPGRGVAYARRDHPYLLNVPAGQMSADAARPRELVEFARWCGIAASPEDFLPRALYGDYLRDRLEAAIRGAPSYVRFVHVRGEAVRVARTAPGTTAAWRVTLAAGGPDFIADDVVLAIGNPPPARLPQLAPVAGSTTCVEDPWGELEPSRADERVLLVGTGLTMVDVVTRLAASAAPPRAIIAISRHGLLPAAQSVFSRSTTRVHGTFDDFRGDLRALVRQVRRRACAAAEAGRDWREVIAEVRAWTPELWRGMSEPARRRFLRHVRTFWDVHRHRLPERIARQLAQMRAAGRLTVCAGRLESVEPVGRGLLVTWRPRGADEPVAITVDRIVNCTGPDYRVTRSTQPLVRRLLRDRLIVPDPLELGIEVAATGEVLDAERRPVPRLYYVGPWLRARFWEATAVPELREHVAALAWRLALPAHETQSGAGRRIPPGVVLLPQALSST